MLWEEAGRVVGQGMEAGQASLGDEESFSGLRKRSLEKVIRPQRAWEHNRFQDPTAL